MPCGPKLTDSAASTTKESHSLPIEQPYRVGAPSIPLATSPWGQSVPADLGALLHVPPVLGVAATEARLRQIRSPWLLHIATHGLFVGSALAGSRRDRATMVGAQPSEAFDHMTGRTGDRSLSRSALVLAGAAHAATANDATAQPHQRAIGSDGSGQERAPSSLLLVAAHRQPTRRPPVTCS
jgi:hypothetical protein